MSNVEFFILTNTQNNKHSTIPITPLLNDMHSKILIWKKNYYPIQNLWPVFYLAANINFMILTQQQKYWHNCFNPFPCLCAVDESWLVSCMYMQINGLIPDSF